MKLNPQVQPYQKPFLKMMMSLPPGHEYEMRSAGFKALHFSKPIGGKITHQYQNGEWLALKPTQGKT